MNIQVIKSKMNEAGHFCKVNTEEFKIEVYTVTAAWLAETLLDRFEDDMYSVHMHRADD